MALRIILADDHPMLIHGVGNVLKEIEAVEVIDTVQNGRQLIDVLRGGTVADIVLLDLNMPKLDGVDTLKRIKSDFPRIKIIVFTSYNQPKVVKEIKDLGAEGFLLKSSDSVLIKEVVLAVAAGKKWFPAEQPSSESRDQPYGSGVLLSDDFTKKYQITKREVEILRMIAQGMTTKTIGETMSLSEFTISTHRRNICRKLNIYTPVGLLNFAREHGLI